MEEHTMAQIPHEDTAPNLTGAPVVSITPTVSFRYSELLQANLFVGYD